MKFFAIVGSGRVGGNTDRLTDAFLKGAAERGHQIAKLHLGETEVRPCLGCNACAQDGVCIQADGMERLLPAFLDCDVVVLATPVYFWGISAQLKAVIDRFYALGEKDPKGYYRYPQKRCVLLATAADSDRHFWTFELVEHYYRRLARYLRWTDLGILTAGGCGGTAVPRCIEDTDHLQRAYRFGQSVGALLT